MRPVKVLACLAALCFWLPVLLVLMGCQTPPVTADAQFFANVQAHTEATVDAAIAKIETRLSGKIDAALTAKAEQSGSGNVNINVGKIDGLTIIVFCLVALALGIGLFLYRKKLAAAISLLAEETKGYGPQHQESLQKAARAAGLEPQLRRAFGRKSGA